MRQSELFPTPVPLWFEKFYLSLSLREVFSQKTGAILKSTGKSREYVCRLFKKATGSTIGVYLNKIRIEHACSLLKNTEADIIDIALESGFENLSTFYHLFKKEIGVSPKQYRESK
jgi:AraC family cel operon transcriptional repressor